MTTHTSSEVGSQQSPSATERAGEVARTATQDAGQVVQEIGAQARGLVDDVRVRFDEQASAQRDNAVTGLRTFAQDLNAMAEGRPPENGMALDTVRGIASKAQTWADSLDGRTPRELMDRLDSFARRRPGAFLLGALAAGIVTGRLVRGSAAARSESSSSGNQLPGNQVQGSGMGDGTMEYPPVGTSLRSAAAGMGTGGPAGAGGTSTWTGETRPGTSDLDAPIAEELTSPRTTPIGNAAAAPLDEERWR